VAKIDQYPRMKMISTSAISIFVV